MRVGLPKPTVFLVAFTLCVLSAAPAAGAAGPGPVPSGAKPLADENPRAERRALKTALVATSFALGSLAVIMEVESDRAYSRYLDVANPVTMDSQYEKAERFRNLSSAALIGAQVCAIAFVVLSMGERPVEQFEPGSVRVSVYTGPCRAGVTLAW